MPEEAKMRKRVAGNLPHKEADLITVARKASTTWENRPELTLIWTNSGELKQTVDTFEASFTVRNETKGTRQTVTQSLKSINVEIDQSTEYVKGYLIELFTKKEATAYYQQFGILREKNRFKLPGDNDKRLFALEAMVNAVVQHNLGDRKYGEEYWRDLSARFAGAKNQASESDSTSSEHVGVKTTQRTAIRQTLNALVLLIKANYPQNWKEELRVWGFQKEKY